MICDAMMAANHVYKFDKVIYDPVKYCKLTDSILRSIENYEIPLE